MPSRYELFVGCCAIAVTYRDVGEVEVGKKKRQHTDEQETGENGRESDVTIESDSARRGQVVETEADDESERSDLPEADEPAG